MLVKQLLLLLLGVQTMALAHAQEAPLFKVTPHLCIMDDEQAVCDIEVTVEVAASHPPPLCILIALAKPLRECFDTNVFSKHFQLSITNTTKVSLVSYDLTEYTQGNTMRELASQAIKVGHLNPDNYRIKRRFGWGI